MKLKSDFYRLSWYQLEDGVYHLKQYDHESQQRVLDQHEELKISVARLGFELSFISWEMPLDD